MRKKIITFLITAITTTSLLSAPVFAQNKQRVTLGVDLNEAQQQQMLDEFGVTSGQVTIDKITNDDIIKQLGLDPNDKSNYVGGCYSSSYVKLTSEGGIKVKTHNLTEVTGLMLSNALLTSGINNADVVASSPFPVTGTSALAGILKGVEGIQGKELSLKNKEVAQKEMVTTSELAEEVGPDAAATIMNDIKTEVIKEKPKNDKELNKIVQNVTNNYNITISQTQINNITNLMKDVNSLDINYDSVKDTLDNLDKQLTDALDKAGQQIFESNFFKNLWNNITEFFSGIWDWCVGLFDSGNDQMTPSTDESNNKPSLTPEVAPEGESTETPAPEGDTGTTTDAPADNGETAPEATPEVAPAE